MSDYCTLVSIEEQVHVLSDCVETVLVSEVSTPATILEHGQQGVPGPPGDIFTAGGLAIMNRLSEFDTAQARSEARQNLGIEYIDAGTF